MGNDVVASGDGGWLITGALTYATDPPAVAVWKLSAGGTLDTQFGTGGLFSHNTFAGESGYAIDSTADGGWVIAGSGMYLAGNLDMFVWKLSSTGSLDQSFAEGGIFHHHNAAGGDNYDSAKSIIVLDNNEWIVAGRSYSSFHGYDMALWKFKEGKLDPSFGNNGVYTHNSAAGGNDDDFAEKIAKSSNGDWVVVGNSIYSQTHYAAVVW